jgi:hypothetical protein
MTSLEQAFPRLLGVIIVLGLPPAIVLSNLYILMSPAYVRYEYGKAGFPPATLLSEEQRYTAAVECIRYLRTGVGIEALQRLEGSGGPLFNKRELRHMADAKKVAQGAFTFHRVCAVLITAVVNFNWFFTAFHRVFFEGDTWLFPYTDTLIQLFPLPFWFDIVQLWVLGTVIESCAVGGLALWWLRRLLSAHHTTLS